MKTYFKLLAYLKPYWKRLLLAIGCMVVVGALSAVPAYLLKYVVDDLFIERKPLMLMALPLAVVGTYLIKGFFSYVQTYLMYWIGQRVVMDVRNHLYTHLINMPLSFFSNVTTGEMMSKIIYDISLMQKAASQAVRDMGRHFFSFLFLLGVAFYMNWFLTTIFLIALPPLALLVSRLGEKIRRATRETQEKMGDITSLMKESFSGVRVVKGFNAEGFEQERFQKANRRFFSQVMRAMRARALAPPVVEVIGGLGAGFVLWYGSWEVLKGEVSPGEFTSFLGAIGMIYNPLRGLTRVYHTIQEGVAATESVFEIMGREEKEELAQGGIPLRPLKQGISLRHVSFSYENVPVLQDINLEIKAGSAVAIVGLSGAGKTTLLDLLTRFYKPTEGKIYFDGVEIGELDVRSLREGIGLVTQQVFLFNDTVERNIAYGMKEFSRERVVAAAKAANAHNFIEALPQGYESIVGEEGVKLSGGERQRIAIARAIIKNPSILILDEAMSALDSESEVLIQEALERLMRGRTTIIVAHRLSTIRGVDTIAVVDGGQIVETGTHSSLMQRGGLYKRLHDLQFQEAALTD